MQELALDLRRPFGAAAERYTRRLPAGVSVIAADPEHAALAVAAAADLRRRGVLFYAAPLLEDGRAARAQAVAGQLLIEHPSVDERRAAFDALACQEQEPDPAPHPHMGRVASPQLNGLRDLVILSDAVLARSTAAQLQIARELAYRRRFRAVAPGIDESVPWVVSRAREAIVVWAPQLDAARLGVIGMALELFACEVVFICAAGSLPGIRGEFARPAAAAQHLARASCIVDASIADPGAALALTRVGVPVIAAATSGAGEFAHGMFEYDPWSYRSVHAAVARARGVRPPAIWRNPVPSDELREILQASAPPARAHGPLVSIVLPTYNRPESLAKSLDYIAAQTYKDLDVIVVNDGGCDISDVCARYPFARLIDLEQNVGNPHATRAGMDHIRGKYFGFWGDDDWYCPDHFARLVDALETTDGYVGHAQTMTRYYVDRPGGGEQTRAYKILHERPNDPIEMLTGPTMTFGLMLFRSELLDEIGYIDPASSLIDTEYQLRASQRYDFVAVDAVTGQWNYNIELKTYQHQIGEGRYVTDQKAIYTKFPTELACVNVRRERWLKRLTESYNTVLWPPDLYLPDDFVD